MIFIFSISLVFAEPSSETFLEPVAYWSLDEGVGNITADGTGNGHEGFIYGSSWTEGFKEKSLSFDGVDDFVNFGNSNDFDMTHSFTISLWAKGNMDRNEWQEFIYKGPYDNRHYGLRPKKDTGQVQLQVNGISLVTTDSSLEDDVWYHVVGVFDINNSVAQIYINGVIEKENPSFFKQISTGNDSLTISKLSDTNSEYFQGVIDEVGIWNKALTDIQVKELYNMYVPDDKKFLCIDSDGGRDYYTKGYVEMIGDSSFGDDGKKYDECRGGEYLGEYVCINWDYKGDENFKCPNGCEDGACILVEEPKNESEPSQPNEVDGCSTLDDNLKKMIPGLKVKAENSGNQLISREGSDIGEGDYVILPGAIVQSYEIYNSTGSDYTKDKVHFKDVVNTSTSISTIITFYSAKFISEGKGKIEIRGDSYKLSFSGTGEEGIVNLQWAPDNEIMVFNCVNGVSDGEECVPDYYECVISPTICPSSGVQTKYCEGEILNNKCDASSISYTEEIKCDYGMCSGCELERGCIPYGFRTELEIGNYKLYCDVDGELKEQKTIDAEGNWASCQNNYECESNLCSGNECVDVTSLLQEANKFKKAIINVLCGFIHPLSEEKRNACKISLLE